MLYASPSILPSNLMYVGLNMINPKKSPLPKNRARSVMPTSLTSTPKDVFPS